MVMITRVSDIILLKADFVPKFVKYLLIAFAALALCAAGALWFVTQQFSVAGPLEAERVVVIERGTGFSDIARQLEREGVIEDARLFMISSLLRRDHKNVQAGEYAFAAHASGSQVLDKLVSGDVVAHRLTLIEGWTNRQIAQALLADNALSGDVPNSLLDDAMQGQFLPDTVQFTRGMTRAHILEGRKQAMQKLLEELWQNRAQDLPFDTPQDALVLASIIERETGIVEEQPLISGVYQNRIRLGMRLQADPTVQYGIEQAQGAPLERALTTKDVQTDTVFNTYTRNGLPPTPICNPGRASIEAALHPAQTDALYFVADGNGGHVFAKTLAEHNANVAAYRLALKEKSIDQ